MGKGSDSGQYTFALILDDEEKIDTDDINKQELGDRRIREMLFKGIYLQLIDKKSWRPNTQDSDYR